MNARTLPKTTLGGLLMGTLLLSACGSADAETEPGTNSEEAVEISVGTLNGILSAPLFLGVSEGIFEEHGLDVDISFADGGAAVIPAVLSGEYQFGYSNTVSQLAALGEGLPLQLVHPSWAPHGEFEDDDHGLLTLPDNGFDEPEDLEGANIAVNTLQNIGEVHIRTAFDNLGLDHSDLTWTQLPFSDMSEALERGDVDAIWVSEPFLAPGLDAGYEWLIAPGAQSFPEQVGGFWSTSETFAEESPEVVESFREAMTEINDFAGENPELVREVAVEEMGFDADYIDDVNLPMFPNDNDIDALEDYAEAAVEFGIIDELPEDYEALFAD
ncbi:ABC transporter substrate-binding protein [Nesterenkonia haasae]|uniref:ABC transporter substrate-binding protein n=1 Tax=Nesterenkonia haasae TaxID=2587813 RepID=UPI001390D499|nr:ABC transporter substrate-binding protein [Nesterenkonia haasae]NDK31698.1 nitrate ABC transporter substrate-binding protein [Nesterenkonia haasae]